MISSEVKRTLVKSPPELWTELSDPKTLARHLGDFGDIRITGSVPEQMVEWESDRARGRVVLKPSGWGTKVTLTVTGELPLGPPAPTGGEPSGAPSEAADQAVSASEIHTPDEPEGADAPELAVATLAAEGATGPTVETEPAPSDTSDAIADADTPADPDPMPGIDPMADPDAMADPEAMADADPMADSDWPERPLAELVPPPLSAAAIAAETSAEAKLEPATAPAASTPAEQPPAAEPRRGFFARLLKRGRPVTALPALPLDERVDAPTATPAQREPPSAPGPVAEPTVLEHGEPVLSPAALSPAPQAAPSPAPAEVWVSPPEPEPAAVAPAVAEPTEPGPLVAPDAVGVADRPVAVASQAPAEIDVESPQGGEEGSGTAPQSAVERLSSELRTAEETTEEHVRMVLTSVLDRLGSAHHRPFSRS